MKEEGEREGGKIEEGRRGQRMQIYWNKKTGTDIYTLVEVQMGFQKYRLFDMSKENNKCELLMPN